jgi:copper ion binding protein
MTTMRVTGMTCGHCVAAVSRAVKAIPGVENVSVDLASGQVVVDGPADKAAIEQAIVEEGYEVSL